MTRLPHERDSDGAASSDVHPVTESCLHDYDGRRIDLRVVTIVALGLVIVGGLVISQLITSYITPVIYLALESFQERVLDRVPFLRSGHMHHETDGNGPGLASRQPSSAAS